MKKIGYLFAGQGQQFVRMGHDLAEHDDAKKIYQTAEKILGYNVLNLTEEELSMTSYTQPALYVLGHVIDTLLKKQGYKPSIVAGLSLGEYNALTSASSLSFEDGLALINKRAHIMNNALEPYTSGMAACLKTDVHTVSNLLKDTGVEVCNINTPSQIVIGGSKANLDKAIPLLKEGGVKMVIPLKMSTVSHMSLLEPASELLRQELKGVNFKAPEVPFINNIQASYQKDGFVDTLSQHISNPTRMADTIKRMNEDGVELFIEIGPKGQLSKFVKEICGKDTATLNIYDAVSLGDLYE